MQQTTFNTINAKAGHEWAEVIWRTDARNGVRVVIFSSYGDWSFYWSHPGSRSVELFLASLEMEYMGGKMMGAKFMKSSPEVTAKERKRCVMEMRKECSLSKQEALDEWNLAERLDNGDIGFETFIAESNIEDTWDSIFTEPDPGWKHFWDRLWLPHLQPALSQIKAAA